MLFISGLFSSLYPPRKENFNLVIEMLFISGSRRTLVSNPLKPVSISSSRCFSFQGNGGSWAFAGLSFNLVIEMLFISGRLRIQRHPAACSVSISSSRCFSFQVRVAVRMTPTSSSCFNLVIEMLFISGKHAGMGNRPRRWFVSISSSRCFSFQGNPLHPQARHQQVCFNLVIEMLFIPGIHESLNTAVTMSICFNLVIEMLFIPGNP